MQKSSYADIILPLALNASYTYLIPEKLKSRIKIGSRVVVQFGRNKHYTGIVEQIHDDKPSSSDLKTIMSIPEEVPSVSILQIKLWKWISNYYMCTRGEVMNAALPAGLNIDGDATSQAYKPREEIYITLKDKYSETRLNEILDSLVKSPAQYRLMSSYLELSEFDGFNEPVPVKRTDLLNKAITTMAPVSAMIRKKLFKTLNMEASRLDDREIVLEATNLLTEEQSAVFKKIKELHKTKMTVLLKGVTSSGKTEIYIQLIKDEIKKGNQVLYLLPEIALTTQMITRLKRHFGNSIGVYHSQFSNAQRVEVLRRTSGEYKENQYQIILGVRSSLFLPFRKLGLVIIDEEHDNSYKQYDPAPRYNARDTAMMLSQLHGAKVLLGSATPSLESMYNSKEKKYGYVELKERFGKINMPEIIMADTRVAYKRKAMISHFTPQLIKAMDEALERKEQIVLFRNRRGFAPFIMCMDCGWIPICNNCSVSMTYHKSAGRLYCHYCGSWSNMSKGCDRCDSTNLEMRGFGTEKIEDEIKILKPDIRVARMDLDTTRRKGSINKIITDLENRMTDILIGTQMISKGLDFEGLTVVGILNLDNMLYYPDFRAHEKCFQLIEQVSGRAGRREKRGKVVIQTSDPEHAVMRQALNHDYEGMYKSQIEERREFNYPPFTRLIRIYVKHKDRTVLNNAAGIIASNLKNILGESILGPEFPPLSRLQTFYIKTILIKINKDQSITKVKKLIEESFKVVHKSGLPSSLRTYADVDPV